MGGKKEKWYNRTESILYNYPGIEPAIANLEASLRLVMQNKMPSGTSKVYGRVGPPTTGDRMTEPEAWADRRAATIEKIEAKIQKKQAEKIAVDGALERLGDEERDLVRLWYFESWKLTRPDKPIWNELSIGSDTFTRRKLKTITKIAVWLGEYNEYGCQEGF